MTEENLLKQLAIKEEKKLKILDKLEGTLKQLVLLSKEEKETTKDYKKMPVIMYYLIISGIKSLKKDLYEKLEKNQSAYNALN